MTCVDKRLAVAFVLFAARRKVAIGVPIMEGMRLLVSKAKSFNVEWLEGRMRLTIECIKRRHGAR